MDQETSEVKWMTALRHCQNVIAGSANDHEKVSAELENIVEFLKGEPFPTKLRQHLGNFLENLICNADLQWISHSLEELDLNISNIVLRVFLQSPPDCSLVSLTSSLAKLSAGARQALSLRILECYFRQGQFVSLLLNECTLSSPSTYTLALSSRLISLLSSLPDRIANNTNGKFSPLFHHERFFQFLAIQTTEVLEKLVEKVRNDTSITVKFVAEMTGHFCFCGKSDPFLGTLLPYVIMKTKDDFIWRKLMHKIISSVPERCLEMTVVCIVKNFQWYGCMRWIFSDLILQNSKLKFILLHKLLLMKHFPNPSVLQNIIGYVADDAKTRHLVLETLKKLLSVWSDTSAIRHVSYEQHKYVTQAIIVCVGHLTEEQCKEHKEELTLSMMPGISSHLDSSEVSIRHLGMIVGEVLTARLDTEGKNKLKFEYTKDAESESLTNLATPDCSPNDDYFDALHEHFETIKETVFDKLKDSSFGGNIETYTTSKSAFLKSLSPRYTSKSDRPIEKENSAPEIEEITPETVKIKDLDSDDSDDDDLQPYDMSNDTVHSKVKRPIYIRDCMEGLMQTEDREKMEVCLSSVKTLIEQNPVAAKEVSVELCKLLLLLDDTFALDNFTLWRHSAMTSLAVVDPKKVASCLTTQFYTENYTLQHRLDMLDVLTSAAGVLSSVERSDKAISEPTKRKAAPVSETSESWREIVDRRIESKTRRFGKAKKKPIIPPKANQFGPVAGCFFYPLLAGYDRRVRTLDLLGTDSLVLGRLLYSVGNIVYSAMNTMAVSSMARSLLEFVLELRYHPEAYVRQATLFCVSMAVLSSGNTLADSDVMYDVNDWITDVMSRDSNSRTKELAAQTYMIVTTAFKNHLK